MKGLHTVVTSMHKHAVVSAVPVGDMYMESLPS